MKKIFLFACFAIVVSVQAAEQITIAQFLNQGDTQTAYRLRGEVTNIASNYYGNFTLVDATGSIYIYGMGDPGDFQTLGIEEGDTITLEGTYKLYGSKPEIERAQYISHTKPSVVWVPVPISISEFISRNDGKRYILTGVVTSITDASFGRLYIQDATGSIYIYNLTDAEGNAKSFSNLGIQAGDTLTLNGVYQLYNTTSEVVNPRYMSHKHPTEIPDPDPEIDYTQTTVDFDKAFAKGWSGWIGKTLTFTNDFYLCNTYDKVAASHRLRNPEEYGEPGTEKYEKAIAKNSNDSCVLSNISFQYNCRPGAIISGMQAFVSSANNLQVVNTPSIAYNEFPTTRPDLGNADLVVCGANIENFFVTLGGYAGASSQEQLAIQKTKISSALSNMDADIYALCEVEQGPLAATELVRLLDSIAGKNQYDWVNAGFATYDGIMVCFIYRKDKVTPYSNYIKPYNFGAMQYREAIQCFEQLGTGERFNISLNHFYAKRSKTAADRQENMQYLINKLPTAASNDPDILVLGDLNAYTNEESNLKLSRDYGYTDLLMKYSPDDYSYVWDDKVGYLDHAYCSPSMESQVTKAVPYHLNADTKTSYKYTNGNTSMYRYADHDPILVGLKLGNTGTAIDEVAEPATNCKKVIRNGQLIIERDGVQYTITGIRLQ